VQSPEREEVARQRAREEGRKRPVNECPLTSRVSRKILGPAAGNSTNAGQVVPSLP
jgi:hypothetical protein